MIWLILASAFFLRTYRISDYLGFWYDQGRDAIVISDLLHKFKFFLIGPTTGIEGIFLGPFYYYLMAPFYWLGRGNPVVPAIFLAVLSVATIYLIYRIGAKYMGHWAGIIAACLYTFSFQLIGYNRWLSNPTPLPFFATALVWWILDIVHGSKKAWIWVTSGLFLGLCLQLEAASATFFLPALVVITIIYRKEIPFSVRKVLGFLVAFGVTLVPQLWFNLRNQNILFNSFNRFLVEDKSFQTEVTNFYSQRLTFYFEAFTNKFVLNHQAAIALVILTGIFFVFSWKVLPRKSLVVLLVWWLTPMSILLFYHGNHGYVWDYYFTGIYPVVCLVLGIVFYGFMVRHYLWFKWLPLVVLTISIGQNLQISYDHYVRNDIAPFIALTQVRQAVDWVYQDAQDQPFNFDVYVPPVLYESYKYVFSWLGETNYRRQPNTELVKRLYTLREPDGEHPQFLAKWMVRQAGIGTIDKTTSFGSIIIERRIRNDVNRN